MLQARAPAYRRHVRVRILGAVRAEGGEGPLELGPRRQRALLARLVLAGGQPVAADALIEDLWQGNPPAKAQLSLQAHVARLRRVLEPEHRPHRQSRVLAATPQGYVLRLPEEAVDAWQFASLVEAGRLEEALQVWAEPVCGEFAGQPWAREAADWLETMHRVAVERRRIALLEAGRAPEALMELEAAVARDPAHGDTRRMLALALHRSGRRDEAIAVLREAPARGPAVQRMEAALLDRDQVRLPPPRAGGRRARFVGREREQATLREAASTAAATGRGALVMVGGDALIGKTALVERLAQWLTAEGWAVAWGSCAEHPWQSVFAQLAEQYEQARQPSGTLRAAVRLLPDLARTRPLLIVLDDLHEADGETVSLLEEAARETGMARVVIVVAYRSNARGERLDAALAKLALREPYRMGVGGLTDEAVGQLLGPALEETVAVLARRTGGHPFFVRELTRLIWADGEAAAVDGVPDGVRDALRHRVAGLSEHARRLLDRAVVLGLERAIDQPGEADVNAVEDLLRIGLIEESADGVIRFASPIVRDALRAELSVTCQRHIRSGRSADAPLPSGR